MFGEEDKVFIKRKLIPSFYSLLIILNKSNMAAHVQAIISGDFDDHSSILYLPNCLQYLSGLNCKFSALILGNNSVKFNFYNLFIQTLNVL